MAKVSYFFRVLSGVSFKKMFEVLNRAHEKCGKNRFLMFFDILLCAPLYGAGYYDYLIFGFYNMNHAQRNTFVTRIRNKKLISRLNDWNYHEIFENKGEFYRHFGEYLGRQVRDIKDLSLEEFCEFMQDNPQIFAKPYKGESGKGIEKLSVSDFGSLSDMYAYITDGRFGVIEQLITQHEALNAIYPLSINTYRIVTIVTDGSAKCVYATAKFGNGGKFVDNLENGGVCCPIDMQTGKINGCAHTSALVCFDEHPYTHIKLFDYQLPYVKEAIELCLKAAMVVPQMGFIGWDVFISPDGPGLVEGNDFPGYDFAQLPEWTPEKIGLWPYYKKLIPDL